MYFQGDLKLNEKKIIGTKLPSNRKISIVPNKTGAFP
jgi:hypothetical protein